MQQQNTNKYARATRVLSKTSKTNKKVKSEEVKDLPTTSYNGKFFSINLDIYNADVFVSVNQDNEDIVIALVENGIVPSLESPLLQMYMDPFMNIKVTSLATTALYDNGVIGIKIKQFYLDDNGDMATLVHELSHAVMYTFDRIGMPHNADTDEAYSYLLGFLVKKFFENMR